MSYTLVAACFLKKFLTKKNDLVCMHTICALLFGACTLYLGACTICSDIENLTFLAEFYSLLYYYS
jgi:hypothetical protein